LIDLPIPKADQL